jgi:UDP-N-acetylmuramoyl-L-alanyl-D-glutamate--2,6-diaminopimelate ligase
METGGRMKIKDLIAGASLVEFSGSETDEIVGLSYSSQTVKPGFLFAALKGERKDGFDFIPEALQKGAAAVLSERPVPSDFRGNWIQVTDARKSLAFCSANFYSHPSQSLTVIGITGTKGKTTITYLLENILKVSGFEPGVIGTISYRGPGVKIKAKRTTPEAPDLQRMMKKLTDQKATHCVMEVSSHSLELDRVLGIDFDVAVFTNLSGEHLDYHQTMEKYYQAKKKLFFLSQEKRMAVINTDDSWGQKLISELHRGVITYGTEQTALIRAENIRLFEEGIEFNVLHPGGKMALSSSLLGRANLYNILAAAATGLTLHIPEAGITEGISTLHGVPGRFQKIQNARGLNIFVDYAHNDDALRNLLETVREFHPQRIILVFGAGGDRDKTKRPRMGKVAGSLADFSIITSDNPRSENPSDIISDIEAGMKKTGGNHYTTITDRKDAIRFALSTAEAGDYILVAGKGHEDYQIIKDTIFHFDDAEVIKELLDEMKENE